MRDRDREKEEMGSLKNSCSQGHMEEAGGPAPPHGTGKAGQELGCRGAGLTEAGVSWWGPGGGAATRERPPWGSCILCFPAGRGHGAGAGGAQAPGEAAAMDGPTLISGPVPHPGREKRARSAVGEEAERLPHKSRPAAQPWMGRGLRGWGVRNQWGRDPRPAALLATI